MERRPGYHPVSTLSTDGFQQNSRETQFGHLDDHARVFIIATFFVILTMTFLRSGARSLA